MANPGPFFAYKETRLDLDSTTKSTTVAIRLPPPAGTSTWAKTTQKRSQVTDSPIAEDESSFRQKYLATAASIYHRTHHKSPRRFLWRVLEEGKVLSIQTVDISKQSNVIDTSLILRLTFPNPILPACVAFSDSKEHDTLSVFVLTETKHVYTLTLRPEYFRRVASTEDNVGDWCKSYLPAAFAFKAGHRLAALGPDELLLSITDGTLLRLSRNSGGDGSVWKETHYNEGGWSLRGLISFSGSNTIHFGKNNLDLSTATSIASPVTSIDGRPYAFMVSVDHRLRVWNLRTTKLVYMGDILDQELEPQESAKQVIDPSYSQLVKVFGGNDENALCVTYSPLGVGQFKFWKVTSSEDGGLDLSDMFPNNILEPQTPSAEIWTLVDFSVVLDTTGLGKLTLWALWKNNITYRLHKLDFQTGSVSKVRDAWNDGWEAMATETIRDTPLPAILSSDSADGTDKWLEFILSPGRFTTSTIETGLAIYQRGLGSSKDPARKSGALSERLSSTIASTASLGRTSDGNMDYNQYRAATDIQWRRFYRLLSELDGQRGEALSLVIDPQGAMPWVALADGCTAIRDCSALERIWHNHKSTPAGSELVARPLFAAATFRNSLSDQFLYDCETALLAEIFEEPSLTTAARMRLFYDKCDFANQIGDEEYSQLVAGLGGDFKDLTTHVYEAMLELLSGSDEIDRRPQVLPLAEYGNRLIVKGVQEVVDLHRSVCLDQMILLILIEAEINHGDEGIGFETASVFSQLLTMLKRLELMKWLANTQLSLPLKNIERSNSVTDRNPNFAKKPTSNVETITVLEGVLRHLFSLDLRRNETMTSAVTEVIVQICAPNSEYEAPTAVIQCFLLKNDRVDLAMEFSRFAANDAFSVYVQGRAYLAANDAFTAARLFKDAAFGMAYPDQKMRTDHRSAGYLDETERKLLNAGLPEYYSHIVALFDKDKIYSYVIDFARLSLQFIKPSSEDPQVALVRTEMHSRLFNAAIQTTRYDLAHSLLSLFTDAALQQSSLRTLVTKMCESSHASQLIDLPFITLQDAVDEILAQKCQSIVDVTVGVPYHKILYAWRIQRSDFRGAAAISLERLQRLQQSGDGDDIIGDDGLETPITRQYIILINALSCVDPKQAWILSEEIPKKSVTAKGAQPRRKVVTLDDIRREYQEELDRIAAIENNQFSFAGGDEMDVL